MSFEIGYCPMPITVNELMIGIFEGSITPSVLNKMLTYLEMFHLESAVFKIGNVEQQISRQDILAY